METINKYEITKEGYYGNFGGQLISEDLKKEYTKIAEEFLKIKDGLSFGTGFKSEASLKPFCDSKIGVTTFSSFGFIFLLSFGSVPA